MYVPLPLSLSLSLEDCLYGRSTLQSIKLHQIQLRPGLLVDDVEKNRVHHHVAVHVYPKPVGPPQHLGRTGDIDRGIERHLPVRHVGQDTGSVVGELDPVEAGREVEEAAGAGGLRAGVDLSGAEEGAVVEDGHGGGGVLDGDDVGVGDVDGEDELHVEGGDVELEGGEADGDEVEGGVLGSSDEDRGRCCG